MSNGDRPVLLRAVEHAHDWELSGSYLDAHPWDYYAVAYRRAAEHLFARVAADRANWDTLFYPLGFLWRHYLELRLKDIIVNAKLAVRAHPEFRFKHSLKDLWEDAMPLLLRTNPTGTSELAHVEPIVMELDARDPDRAEYFRYPSDTRGKVTAGPQPDVDLENFHATMMSAADVLDPMARHLNAMGAFIDYLEPDGT
jgi:hypothetical protein